MASLSLIIDGRPAKVGAREFKQAVDSIKRGGREAAGAADGVTRGFRRIKDQSAGLKRALGGVFAGLSAALVARQIAQVVSGFELVLATVKGVTGATEAQFARLQATARDLGATTRFSAKEAGEGLLFLARAGFTTEQAIAAIPATLNLAAAGALGLGEAADFASNILSQFGLSASETERVADTLVKTANSANTDVRQLAEAMKFAGPVAGALGISVEKAAAAVGVLGDSGIQASLAGTNLRGILAGLLGPTAAGEKAIRGLGLSLTEVDPATQDLVDIFRRFRDAGLTAANAVDIFGRRNAAAALILAAGVEKVDSLTKANQAAAGEAERLAKIMSDTLSGSFKNLRSAIEEAFLATGDTGFAGALRKAVDVTTEAIRILLGLGDASKVASDEAFRLAAGIRAVATAAAAFVSVKLIFAALTTPVTAVAAAIAGLVYLFADSGAEAEKHAIKIRGLDEEYLRLKGTLQDLAAAEEAHTTALRRKDDFLRQRANEQRLAALQKQLREYEKEAGEKGRDAASAVTANALRDLVPDYLRSGENRLQAFQLFDLFQGRPGTGGTPREWEGPIFAAGQVGDLLNQYIAAGAGENLAELGFVIDALRAEIENAQAVVDAGAAALEGRQPGDSERLNRLRIEAELDYHEAAAKANEALEKRGSLLSVFIDLSVRAAQVQKAESDRADAVQDFIGSLQTQLEIERAVGDQREVLSALARIGVATTEDEAAAVRALVLQLLELSRTRDQVAESTRAQAAAQEEARRKFAREQQEAAREAERRQKYAQGRVADVRGYLLPPALRGAERDIANQNLTGTAAEAVRDLARLEDTARRVDNVATGIGRSFADSFAQVASGSASVSEGLRNLTGTVQQVIIEEISDVLIGETIAQMIRDLLGAQFGLIGSATKAGAIITSGGQAAGAILIASAQAASFILSGGAAAAGAQAGNAGSGAASQIFSGTGNLFARGGAFQHGDVVAFAGGGVLSSPAVFPLRGGRTGLAGEAGPEAILPLRRGANGKLGVESSGGGGGTVVNMTVVTQDAGSFARSKRQIENDLRRSLASRRN